MCGDSFGERCSRPPFHFLSPSPRPRSSVTPTPRPADLRRCVFATASYVCVARHERPPSPPFAPAAYTLLPPLLVTRAMKPDVPQLLLVEEDELLADITAFRLELLTGQIVWWLPFFIVSLKLLFAVDAYRFLSTKYCSLACSIWRRIVSILS